jgi:SPP1 family predicted phage head-tail adaptor
MKCVASYDKRITVQRLSGTADAHGFVDNTTNANWTGYASSFASVKTKGGREFWKVQQVNADVSHVWMCPWSKTLAAATPDMRLICEGVTYEILSVIDIDLASQEIEIQTRRAVV